ncbi:hypothetical protein [Salegentibacter sp. BLCTC]|uniref:hypothetical protein n=1 Tax=Salegentibacter sp. BLCTC TaxID=2697368 RepID=UPI001D126B70|nr:hypothetical protein [Salegentibacter sp. BLCTC]
MKSSEWLSNIFSIAYYLMIFGWIILLGFLLYAVFINPWDILKILRDAEEFKIESGNALYTTLTYELLSGGFWIYIFLLFKKLDEKFTCRPIIYEISDYKLQINWPVNYIHYYY